MRKALFIFLSFLLTALSVSSLLLLKPKNIALKTTSSTKYLEVWQIDMVEGGINSRAGLLSKIGNSYQKQTGVLVRVLKQTVISAQNNFKKGIYPDIISYSGGLDLPYDKLLPLNEQKEYALCWCKGGYCLITREGVEPNSVIISKQENAISLLAYYLGGVNLPIKCEITSTKAIYEFYGDKNCALLGTQRDIFRLQNKDIPIRITPITAYSDIYQYLSVVCESSKFQNCKNFVNYLLVECAKEGVLQKIGMLPADCSNKSAICQELTAFYNFCPEYTVYPLTSKNQMQVLMQKCLNYQTNAESIKNALKRLK